MLKKASKVISAGRPYRMLPDTISGLQIRLKRFAAF